MSDVGSVARRRRARVLNWDQNKSLILQLWVAENKPLREVCDIMRVNHGFDAT
jgi:Clr5 domain